MQRTVDLSAHINQDRQHGNPADFPISLRPIYFANNSGGMEQVRRRFAVVREDLSRPVAIVSDRYALVPHQRILDLVEQAIAPLDVGVVPKGIYVDRDGARMRALFKFPALAKTVVGDDTICPCLKIENTYDGTSRIAIHIGAFRFVCTNLAVGGGGVFAGGFLSIHAGDVPIEEVVDQLGSYLTGFDAIVVLYRAWANLHFAPDLASQIFSGLPKKHSDQILTAIEDSKDRSVYGAYNASTWYATHEMRSYRTAFDLLEQINHGFQERFPVS
jgi:hypothetical protein